MYNSIAVAEGFITRYFDSDIFLNYSSAFVSVLSSFVIPNSIRVVVWLPGVTQGKINNSPSLL